MGERAADIEAIERFFSGAGAAVAQADAVELAVNQHTARRFNPFEIALDREVRLGKLMRELLDPAGSHGQGPIFLDLFLRAIDAPASWRAVGASVLYEHRLGQRRIDLYLHGSRWSIGVELKPWAAEQSGQLDDYYKSLEQLSGSPPWRLVYVSDANPTSLSNWRSRDRFVLLPFHRSGAGQGASLLEWVAACQRTHPPHRLAVTLEFLAEWIRSQTHGRTDDA